MPVTKLSSQLISYLILSPLPPYHLVAAVEWLVGIDKSTADAVFLFSAFKLRHLNILLVSEVTIINQHHLKLKIKTLGP